MDNIELIRNYEHLNSRYRFKYHEFANLIEWEELVKLNWWQKLFRTDGQEYVWKRVYFGHATPMEACLETINVGKKHESSNLLHLT